MSYYFTFSDGRVFDRVSENINEKANEKVNEKVKEKTVCTDTLLC